MLFLSAPPAAGVEDGGKVLQGGPPTVSVCGGGFLMYLKCNLEQIQMPLKFQGISGARREDMFIVGWVSGKKVWLPGGQTLMFGGPLPLMKLSSWPSE